MTSDALGAERTREAAAATLPDRIAFLGFGLIGGSIAMALRDAGYTGSLVAWTPNGRGPADAERRGILVEAPPSAESAIDGSGLIVLAGPPLSILNLLGSLAGAWRARLAPDATITDVGSTKGLIVENAGAYGLSFVGGHPMAGRETSGVAAAVADLFVDRPWVVVPADSANPGDVDRVDALAVAVGARPVRIGAADHDAAAAAISHLPLVLSAALVESVASRPEAAHSWPLARTLAASGWRDMSRLARGDPEMGADILATNAGAVAERLRVLRTVLDDWLDRLDPGMQGDGDSVWLQVQLEQARAALEEGGE